MSEDKVRAEFEAWLAEDRKQQWASYCDKFLGGIEKPMPAGWMQAEDERAWRIWQASRASLCVELPESEKDERPYKCYASGWNDMRLECAAALDKAGVKYI